MTLPIEEALFHNATALFRARFLEHTFLETSSTDVEATQRWSSDLLSKLLSHSSRLLLPAFFVFRSECREGHFILQDAQTTPWHGSAAAKVCEAQRQVQLFKEYNQKMVFVEGICLIILLISI